MTATNTLPPLSFEQIRNRHRVNAVLTQLHRWYLLYENDAVPVANALDILSEEITLSSGLGEATGHAAYQERVAVLPQSWDNAHFVTDTDISLNEDGSSELIAQVTYLNAGMKEDGSVRQADLTYRTTLGPTDGTLPEFTAITIAQNSESTAPAFRDAYTENRMRSLIYYWLTLIERPDRQAAPFAELLTDDFALNFSSGVITDMDAFEAWLLGPASQVEASAHRLENLEVSPSKDGSYVLRFNFDWQGIALDGQTELIARTHHTWNVTDNPAERFPRIKQVDVDLLIPFQPRPE